MIVTKISETTFTTQDGYTIHKDDSDYTLEQNKGQLEKNIIPSLKNQVEIAEYFGYTIGSGGTSTTITGDLANLATRIKNDIDPDNLINAINKLLNYIEVLEIENIDGGIF